MSKKTLGATIAAAAALTFATAPVSTAFADDAAAPAAASAQVQCFGVNACKGQSACKTAQNNCNGQNSCKGKGVMMLTPDDCKAKGGSTDAPAN